MSGICLDLIMHVSFLFHKMGETGGGLLNPCQSTFSVTALANALASGLSDDRLSLAAALFTQLGDTLATIALQRSLCQKREEPLPYQEP